jgi:nucleotide-binding universal stress UspA family protein
MTPPDTQWIIQPFSGRGDDDQAFWHALGLALAGPFGLYLLHVVRNLTDSSEWARFPRVRETLERWGYLPAGSEREAVVQRLGVEVRKQTFEANDVAGPVARRVERQATGLVVVGTGQRVGIDAWMHPSVAREIASRSCAGTLIVPEAGRGFVERDGQLDLERIVLPVTPAVTFDGAVRMVEWLLRLLDPPSARVDLLHVLDVESHPAGADRPRWMRQSVGSDPRWHWATIARARSEHRGGAIVRYCEAHGASLVVMTTAASHGFRDIISGSTSELVHKHTHCPLLLVPAFADTV